MNYRFSNSEMCDSVEEAPVQIRPFSKKKTDTLTLPDVTINRLQELDQQELCAIEVELILLVCFIEGVFLILANDFSLF